LFRSRETGFFFNILNELIELFPTKKISVD
jgi:hypothetical protein